MTYFKDIKLQNQNIPIRSTPANICFNNHFDILREVNQNVPKFVIIQCMNIL